MIFYLSILLTIHGKNGSEKVKNVNLCILIFHLNNQTSLRKETLPSELLL